MYRTDGIANANRVLKAILTQRLEPISINTIANTAQLSEKAVRRHLIRLERWGYLKRSRTKQGLPFSYVVRDTEVV